jgi:hypothetical protein
MKIRKKNGTMELNSDFITEKMAISAFPKKKPDNTIVGLSL